MNDVLARLAAKEAEIEALLEETKDNVRQVESGAGPATDAGEGKEP